MSHACQSSPAEPAPTSTTSPGTTSWRTWPAMTNRNDSGWSLLSDGVIASTRQQMVAEIVGDAVLQARQLDP